MLAFVLNLLRFTFIVFAVYACALLSARDASIKARAITRPAVNFLAAAPKLP